MRNTDYNAITSMFVMPGKPDNTFDPNSADFKILVDYALQKAFNDFNFRTLTKESAFQAEYEVWEKKIKSSHTKEPEPKMTSFLMLRLDQCGFLDQFITYFQDAPLSKKLFDDWHHSTCDLFLDILNGAGKFKDQTKAYQQQAYGKAQKIVNMMFKHLYCLKGAEAYTDHFEYCHMVLDNFTLEWFKETLGEKRIDSWSNLIYKEHPTDHKDYMFYQDKIRSYFLPKEAQKHTYAGLTPFQAEFYIWPEIQWLMAAKALLKQKLPEELRRNTHKLAKDDSIILLCDQLTPLLSDLKHHYE